MKIKSWILLLFVLIFMSACNLHLNLPTEPQTCCMVTNPSGGVIGCSSLEKDNAECNSRYFSLGSTSFFSKNSCSEITSCGINCLGYDENLGVYHIDMDNYDCYSKKLYQCKNGKINLVNENGCCYDSDGGLNYEKKGVAICY